MAFGVVKTPETPVGGTVAGGPVPAPAAVMSQARAENFPVASWVLPRQVRQHLLAIYGFARLTDDIGDEVEGDRMAMLAWLEQELERAAAGAAGDPLMRRVGATIRALDLPLDPFRDLIAANRQDQLITRYGTWEELVDYCMLSAAPVGRLVLMVIGLATQDRIALSDQVCIGLQLVEHIQDIGEDARHGRVYMPLEELALAGCDVSDLLRPAATNAVRRLVAREAERARQLLRATVPLSRTLPLRPRLAVAAFGAGGLAALDAVAKARNDVLVEQCKPTPIRLGLRLAGILAASRSPEVAA